MNAMFARMRARPELTGGCAISKFRIINKRQESYICVAN
jgi:hypothetical protein